MGSLSNEALMWLAIAIWIGFAVVAAIGYYVGQSKTTLPSGSTTVVAGGS